MDLGFKNVNYTNVFKLNLLLFMMRDFHDRISFEIGAETGDESPVIHGLLEAIAFRIHHSPNRLQFSDSQVGDWNRASGLLCNYAREYAHSSSFYGLAEESFEAYLFREFSSKARDISNGPGDKGEFQNWLGAVNLEADTIMVLCGPHYGFKSHRFAA